MAQGQKLDAKKEIEIIKDYVGTNNYSATARNTNVNDHTVKNVIERNAKLYDEEKEKFIEITSKLINKNLKRIDEALDKDDNPLSQLTTSLGTLYDKRALAKGDSTSNENQTIDVNINIVE